MVIIKGVHLFQNNESKEYSDLDIMQMLGRAVRLLRSDDIHPNILLIQGRPQFGSC